MSSFPGRTQLIILLLGMLAFVIVWQFVPIPGQVLFVPDNWAHINAWPQVRLNSEDLRPGEKATLSIFDTVPWAYVKLIVGDTEGTLDGYTVNETTGVTQWNWSFTVPDEPGYTLAFYHDCHTGCESWTTVATGKQAQPDGQATLSESIPTKLGVVLANPERDWHNRAGWAVEITYAQLAQEEYWGIDDLAKRVNMATSKGLRVLVRVDYAQGQSIPPPGDYRALDVYLNYLRRLARDDRLAGVYGYIIGSGYNNSGNNTQSPQNRVTPEWYARVLNGYHAPPARMDNAVQTIRAENPSVRILAGPVSPWNRDQNGQLVYQLDVPWLNYFNTVVAAVNQTIEDKTAAGITLVAPDGFAIQAPGRPDAAELNEEERAREPAIDLRRPEWDGAQAGFRVYQDWLSVINAHPHTSGLPVYITATNTFQPDSGLEPAENYPSGWLSTALEVINQESQVVALCWFLDLFPHDDQWDSFSLTEAHGLMADAANEFDSLLQTIP
jgi:hypothetical protein